MSRLLSRGDLLALVDRAAPVVGAVTEDSDPTLNEACQAKIATGRATSQLQRTGFHRHSTLTLAL